MTDRDPVLGWATCFPELVDAAWVLNTQNGRLRGAVLGHWTVDEDLVVRADLLHRLHPWWEVLYGLEDHRRDLVASGVAGVNDRLPR